MTKLNQNQNSKQSYLPDAVLKLYFTFEITHLIQLLTRVMQNL